MKIININKNKNKKAQIGSTLTWFVATLIIFFIMLLFLAAAIALTATKGIKVDKEPVKYSSAASETQKALIVFLNAPVEVQGEKISIKELIKRWDASESKERKNIEKTLQQELNQEFPRYYFTIYRNNPGVFLDLENNPKKVSNEYPFSLIYITSDKGLLEVSLSFSKYEGAPI